MGFRIVTAEPSTASGTAISSSIQTLEDALGFARELLEEGIEVLRIEDDAGTVVRHANEMIVGPSTSMLRAGEANDATQDAAARKGAHGRGPPCAHR